MQRQLELVNYVLKGYSRREMAEASGLKENTVASYEKAISQSKGSQPQRAERAVYEVIDNLCFNRRRNGISCLSVN